MTGALLHALLLAAAIPAAWVARTRLLLPAFPALAVGLAAFVAAHWAWALGGHSPAPLVVAAVLFWIPVVGGRAGPGYVFAGLMLSDTAALWLAATGHPADAVALLGGMLPVAAAFVVVAWRWLRDEEAGARAPA